MKPIAWLVVASAVLLGWCALPASAEEGVATGVVENKDANKADDGTVTFAITLRGQGIWRATFEVGPDNKEAYALVGALRNGEKVTISWFERDDKVIIRKIERAGGAHDGQKE